MRKLAREAVIFCLLGSILAAIAALVIVERQAIGAAKSEAAARAVHGILVPTGITPDDSAGAHYAAVPLTNGIRLYVRACIDPQQPPSKPPNLLDTLYEQDHDCRYFYDGSAREVAQFGGWPAAISLGDSDQVSIEKDYWTAYKSVKRWPVPENLMISALFGLYGFPAGFVLWCLYRLVRFAIFG